MSKQRKTRRTKKSISFHVGRVRANLRGRVWYLGWHIKTRNERDIPLGPVLIDVPRSAVRSKLSESLVGSIMNSTIDKGVFRFNDLATDIQDEALIVRKKDTERGFARVSSLPKPWTKSTLTLASPL